MRFSIRDLFLVTLIVAVYAPFQGRVGERVFEIEREVTPMDDVPPYARPVAIGMAVAAAVGLLVNHFAGESIGAGRLLLLCIGPMALLLGIGGAVEPKIMWSLGNYGQHLPFMYKVIGGCLAVAGLIVTMLLIFVVYPVRFG